MPFAYESPGKLLKVRFCSSDFSNKSRGNSNGRWPGQPGALAGFSHVQRQAMGLQDGEARAPGAGHSWSQQAPMAPWASRESRWCSYSSASVVGYPARIRELNSTIFMGLFQLEIFYDSVTITPTSTQGNPLGLFSLAEQSLGPSERSLQLQQDERCKDSVDKHSRPGRQDMEEQWPQKSPWKIQVGQNDNLFHLEGDEVMKSSHRFPQRGSGFAVLGDF